jgi:hypothetical protein
VRGDADLVQMVEDELADAVVQNALAIDDFVLLLVEGGGIVLEELDQRAWLGSLVQNLGLALVDTAATVHCDCSLVVGALGISASGSISWRPHKGKARVSQSACHSFPGFRSTGAPLMRIEGFSLTVYRFFRRGDTIGAASSGFAWVYLEAEPLIAGREAAACSAREGTAAERQPAARMKDGICRAGIGRASA